MAVGEAIDGGQRVGAAFTSADGTRWQRSTSTFRSTPGRVVATAARLIALAPQLGASAISDAWVSTDGRGWRREETMALPVTAISVAAREETIIAAGIDASGQPTVWRSSDGSPWTQGTGMSKQAIIRNVTAVRDGFVAVGREGEPDTASGGVGVPGRGRPAAWWSADGREWTKLTVEGADASGAQLLSVFGMTGGYLAVGSDTLTASGSPRSPLFWTSVDGRGWRLIGAPTHWGLAGANGRQAVIFAPTNFGTVELGAWQSQDGRQWGQLLFTGDVADVPAFTAAVGQPNHVDQIFVASGGIVVIGQRGGHPAAWFATAVEP